ncbi:hypothetical protein [Novosphingobium sp. 9]|uniref:hypothetical protein n=1 Tax=Novosphingobium sp. 9 TaxID=2025349 RepID=UPI0021B667F2|nr:hypothetical protein [Novosphingobium sp. 9]
MVEIGAVHKLSPAHAQIDFASTGVSQSIIQFLQPNIGIARLAGLNTLETTPSFAFALVCFTLQQVSRSQYSGCSIKDFEHGHRVEQRTASFIMKTMAQRRRQRFAENLESTTIPKHLDGSCAARNAKCRFEGSSGPRVLSSSPPAVG